MPRHKKVSFSCDLQLTRTHAAALLCVDYCSYVTGFKSVQQQRSTLGSRVLQSSNGRTRGKQLYLGGYLEEVDAGRAYDLAATNIWDGEAALNVSCGHRCMVLCTIKCLMCRTAPTCPTAQLLASAAAVEVADRDKALLLPGCTLSLSISNLAMTI